MGKSQREKGARTEREFAKRIDGIRVPLSGAVQGYKGDVVGAGLTWECKARKDGFKTLYGWLEKGQADALAIKADRKEWLVVMPLDKFLEGWNANEI
jgi:Holliday junction resolvase